MLACGGGGGRRRGGSGGGSSGCAELNFQLTDRQPAGRTEFSASSLAYLADRAVNSNFNVYIISIQCTGCRRRFPHRQVPPAISMYGILR